ncbi:MAG TPA: type IV secretory system conjugative DNA transfer family protein [Acidimicrobiales bacterium]|nr:type IV secretory system conjugative DNA transfer family protein [Acidimicrobiales bacterium]
MGAGETVALVAAGAAVALAGIFLAGSHLAAWLAGNPPLRGGLADAGKALWRLPSTFADPGAAWSPEQRPALPGPVPFYLCLALVVVAVIGVALVVAWVCRALGGKRHPLGVDPSAGLAGARDLRRLVVPGPKRGRVILGRVDGRFVATEPQVSLAVVGPSGCGKSVGFAIPALLEWDGPVIATSIKTELVDATVDRRAGLGQVWVFDPGRLTDYCSHWSPLGICGTWGGAMRMAAWLCEAADTKRDTVTNADYWAMQALKALPAHLHAAALDGHTMRDVVRWIDGQDQEPVRGILRRQAGVTDEIERALTDEAAQQKRREMEPRIRAEVLESLRQVLRADPGRRGQLADEKVTAWPVEMQEQFEDRVAIEVDRRLTKALEARVVEAARSRGDLDALVAIESLWAKEERLRGSVYAQLQNVLVTYADPAVASVTERCDIDVDEWLDDANTIYIVASADEMDRLRPVFTVLMQQVIRGAYERANRAGGTLIYPCLLLLDEAGNIVPLKDLPGYAATARSHGISLVTIWQDLAQIEGIYGKRASTVLNNHRAKIFGTGIADPQTLDYVSKLVGDEERTERNFSTDLSGGPRRSVSEHTAYRRLLPMDVIRRMPENQGLLLYGSEPAAHLHLRPWHKDRNLDILAGLNAPRRRRPS